MKRYGFRIVVAARLRFRHEMVMAIPAAHERGTILAGELRHVSREIADGKADAPVVRRVRRRAVHEAHLVQRHLAGTQCDDPPPGMVDLDHHLLAARQEIVFGEGVAMGDLISLWLTGMYSIAPFASVASVKATHAVTTSGLLRPQ